jgi:hypothetical protein
MASLDGSPSKEAVMSTITIAPSRSSLEAQTVPSPAELAAAAFLARYQGRTLEAYRHDLRGLLPVGR